MGWIVIAIGIAVLLATADVFVKLAAGRLSNSLAMLIFGCVLFAISLGWVVIQRVRGVPQFAEPEGVLAAAGVGLAFTLVTLGLYATFSAGAPISIASPLIRLTGLLLASLFGLILLREPLTWRYVAGLLLAIGGVLLVVNR